MVFLLANLLYVPETDIILVLKESLIVGTHIQGDWKGLVRFDTRKSRVEGKFAHGYAHTWNMYINF